MAPVLVTLNDLEGHPQGYSPFAGLFNAILRTFVQHFTRFQLAALYDQLSPNRAWLRSRDCLIFWANKCYYLDIGTR